MAPKNKTQTPKPPWQVQPRYVKDVLDSHITALLEVPLDDEAGSEIAMDEWASEDAEIRSFYMAKMSLAKLRLADMQVRLLHRMVDHLAAIRTA